MNHFHATWIMKICATTLDETAGDLLAQTLKVGYARSSLILIAIFAVTLAAQLRSRNFHPVYKGFEVQSPCSP